MKLYEASHRRVSTAVLNRFAADMARVPQHKGRPLKIYYMAQVDVAPPTFQLVVNTRRTLHFSQKRFLHNRLTEAFDLDGVPIRLIIKPRSRSK